MREFLRDYTEQPQVVPWTIWVDTCVLLDVDTTISMAKNLSHGDAVVESTRLLVRSAAWMALALDIRDEVSVTAGYEAAKKLREEAAPGTLDGAWTHLIANLVRDYVCPNWRVRHTLEGEAPTGVEKKDRNNAHDDFMIDVCLRDNRPLITTIRRRRGSGRRYRPCLSRTWVRRPCRFGLGTGNTRIRSYSAVQHELDEHCVTRRGEKAQSPCVREHLEHRVNLRCLAGLPRVA